MKKRLALLLTVLAVMAAATVKAQDTTSTLSFSGASWNDGGSLDGYFTVQYDPSGRPIELLSADITTGSSVSGFTGFEYILNVEGKADTVELNDFDAIQNYGSPANELRLWSQGFPTYRLFLDWQGSTPTSLYVGDVGGQYSSESYPGAPDEGDGGVRYINSQAGSAGATPEPTAEALGGVGLAMMFIFRRRK
jgi:hypothetical protein